MLDNLEGQVFVASMYVYNRIDSLQVDMTKRNTSERVIGMANYHFYQ